MQILGCSGWRFGGRGFGSMHGMVVNPDGRFLVIREKEIVFYMGKHGVAALHKQTVQGEGGRVILSGLILKSVALNWLYNVVEAVLVMCER